MYDLFALYYDDLTDNVDYEAGSDYISGFLKESGVNEGAKVIDLACGTGTLSLLLKNKGYDVIGVDMSEEMLTVADRKACGSIPFIKAKMQDLVMPDPADACVCCLDSINHLTDIEEVKKTFSSVYGCLKKDGIFIFDVNTIYKHEKILAGNSFVFDKDGYFLAWDNEPLDYGAVRIILDFFVFNGKNYDRYTEEFIERAYEENELRAALEGRFEILGVYDEFTRSPAKKDSQRLYFVCKRL